jgi:REP element-mobilizing transposase RayT
MKEYRKGSHTVYRLHYHFIFLPKYRKPVLRGDVGKRLRELVRYLIEINLPTSVDIKRNSNRHESLFFPMKVGGIRHL